MDLSEDQMTTDLTKSLHCMQQLRQERQLPEPFTTVAVGMWHWPLAGWYKPALWRGVTLVLFSNDLVAMLPEHGRALQMVHM